MNNTEFVQILDPRYNLMKELASLRLLYSLVLYDVIKELSPAGILHYQVELLRCLNYLFLVK